MSKRSNKTKEKMIDANYRKTIDARCCNHCAHMEIFETGTLKGMHYCRPMEYHCTDAEAEVNICDNYMEGSQQDGLIQELASLIIEGNPPESVRKAKQEERRNSLRAERERCLKELAQQKGLFSGIRRRSLQKQINQIEKDLEEL